MSGLQSALDELAAEDVESMADAETLDSVAGLIAARNRLDAQITRRVRHGQLIQSAERDGLKSMRSWLIGHQRLSAWDASRLMRAGRTLPHFPLVAVGFADGSITAAQVDVIADAVGPREIAAAAEQGIDLAAFDEDWARVARESSYDALKVAVQAFQAALDPDGPEPDPTELRSLRIVKHADGSTTGRWDLDAVASEKVQAAIESQVQADRPKGDTRTRAQQNADAFVQIADNQLAAGNLPVLRSEKPHVVLQIKLEDLIDPATGAQTASMGLGAQISAARARWLACDAVVSRVIMGPDGVPLDYGRKHRIVPASLRRAVVARDKTCVFAGCGAPHWWADVHHLVHWINGGETSLKNSALLCERHHTKVHHGFRVERDPGGRWRTYRPDGTEILIGPLIS
ncbi:DUF222 domain-containing protein [Modestobacter sp. NPDC049651]|uniref:HNH endonuclease n=1 Tax=unclassified Modestobacter TaxID=2643866 RepID=UPI0033C19BCD